MKKNILELPVLFDRFLRRVFVAATEEIKEIDLPITPQDIKILMIIEDHASLPISALVSLSHRDKSQITRKINEFEKKQLVERTPSASDQRVSIVSLTPAGEELVMALKQKMHAVLGKILEPLSSEEKEHLANVLRKVT